VDLDTAAFYEARSVVLLDNAQCDEERGWNACAETQRRHARLLRDQAKRLRAGTATVDDLWHESSALRQQARRPSQC
jgi:hypothetical protein